MTREPMTIDTTSIINIVDTYEIYFKNFIELMKTTVKNNIKIENREIIESFVRERNSMINDSITFFHDLFELSYGIDINYEQCYDYCFLSYFDIDLFVVNNPCNSSMHHLKNNSIFKYYDAKRKMFGALESNFKIKKICEKNNKKNLKVISWNINGTTFMIDDIPDLLKKNKPDIILLQENEELLKSEKYIYIDKNIYISSKICPIIIQKEKNILLINTKRGKIVISNVHFTAGKSRSKDRKLEFQSIVNIIKNNNWEEYPIIIGGDTNMRKDEYDMIAKEKFIDSFIEFTGGDDYKNELYKTWPTHLGVYKDNTNLCMARFDRFLIKNFKTINYGTLETPYSDHFLISCVLEIKK
jgi:hypothetical protein